MGSGPYRVTEFVRGSFVRMEAYDDYWGGKPAFRNVIFKFVTDATSRVAEVESGASDITLAIPFEEYDRLKGKSGLTGVTTPVSDIAMIFFNDTGPMEDANVRKAAVHAVNKDAIVDQLLRGYGVPLHTLQALTKKTDITMMLNQRLNRISQLTIPDLNDPRRLPAFR